jgi:hypothetical protein
MRYLPDKALEIICQLFLQQGFAVVLGITKKLTSVLKHNINKTQSMGYFITEIDEWGNSGEKLTACNVLILR